MGYQQKLLFISGMIAMGVAIAIGIRKFHSSSAEANLHALTIDLLTMANKAQQYYQKPSILDGGGRSFSSISADDRGLERIMADRQNLNGSFKIIKVEDQCLTLEATGTLDFDGDGQNLTVRALVYPDSVHTMVISY